MRIAQVAPLTESVPPRLYGGTERVVSHLVDELVALGHEVTLFASGDSRTNARLVPVCPQSLRLHGTRDFLAPHILLLEQVLSRAGEFDVIHFHIAELHFPLMRRVPYVAHVTTLHGRLDLEELGSLYREYRDVPLVSISDAQRAPLPDIGYIATIYHGLPLSLFSYHPKPGNYLVCLGRVSPEKRVDRAIAIATACGMPLKVAAKVDPADREYFATTIEPLLDHPLVEFIGEVDDADKNELLGEARALLFPIDWPEPFGLVMIEALATGLPIVAFRGGSVAEVVDHGLTGFIVDSIEEAADAVRGIDRIDRRVCRETFERRFTARRMASEYVDVYRRLVTNRTGRVA